MHEGNDKSSSISATKYLFSNYYNVQFLLQAKSSLILGTHKGHVQLVPVFQFLEVKLAAPFGLWSGIDFYTTHDDNHFASQ